MKYPHDDLCGSSTNIDIRQPEASDQFAVLVDAMLNHALASGRKVADVVLVVKARMYQLAKDRYGVALAEKLLNACESNFTKHRCSENPVHVCKPSPHLIRKAIEALNYKDVIEQTQFGVKMKCSKRHAAGLMKELVAGRVLKPVERATLKFEPEPGERFFKVVGSYVVASEVACTPTFRAAAIRRAMQVAEPKPDFPSSSRIVHITHSFPLAAHTLEAVARLLDLRNSSPSLKTLRNICELEPSHYAEGPNNVAVTVAFGRINTVGSEDAEEFTSRVIREHLNTGAKSHLLPGSWSLTPRGMFQLFGRGGLIWQLHREFDACAHEFQQLAPTTPSEQFAFAITSQSLNGGALSGFRKTSKTIS